MCPSCWRKLTFLIFMFLQRRGHQEADMLCIGSNQANQRGIGP
ncbi:unnamed protein product, partial [Musa hybrid cultivar]